MVNVTAWDFFSQKNSSDLPHWVKQPESKTEVFADLKLELRRLLVATPPLTRAVPDWQKQSYPYLNGAVVSAHTAGV